MPKRKKSIVREIYVRRKRVKGNWLSDVERKKYFLEEMQNRGIKSSEKRRMDIGFKRIRIPAGLKDFVEKKSKKKLKITPRLYVYYPKRGRKKFDKIPYYFRGGWDGISFNILRGISKKNSDLKESFIVVPKSHLRDKHVMNDVIIHELSEMVNTQHGMNKKDSHSKALKVDGGYLKKHGLTRNKISNRARDLYNSPEGWK
jgi:preprotein translocase subunit Sec61beta